VLLRRVVSNVLGNAIRAAGDSGTVTVEIRRRKGGVVLAVEDDGPGFGKIPAGTGLGLSAVARNVVKHGGRMECGGGGRGGAHVSIWLPLRVGRRSGPVRLIICDDNRILCEALAVALEARGHQVLATATTTALGIAAVATHRPEACLLDLAFSDPPDGLDAARVIRQRYPETAVLMLRGIVAGQGTGQMSREMNVTTGTLRTYVKNTLAKLGAHTRLEAAVLATRENLLDDQTA
jgi:CheY-like chemotaxis protein